MTGCIPEKARLTRSIGLSQEQIDSVELENNLYEEYGVEGGAYTVGTDEETGKTLYKINYDTSGDLGGALRVYEDDGGRRSDRGPARILTMCWTKDSRWCRILPMRCGPCTPTRRD